MRLEGCNAVVTGGASGIGLEVVRCLLQEYKCRGVAIVDFKQDRLDTALAALGCEVEDVGARVSAHLVDVSDRVAVEQLEKAVVERWGNVNVLFCNAGIAQSNTLVDTSFEELDHVLNVNLYGVINCTKIFLPHLIRQPCAAIVNTSSMEGILAIPGNLLYATSKYAVRGFSEGLMVDLQITDPHVQVSVVHPGFVTTDILDNNREFIRTDTLTPKGWGDKLPEISHEAISKGFKSIGSTTPREAALQILRGVSCGKRRILVGNDCVILDFLVRMFPQLFYSKFLYFPIISLVTACVRLFGKKALAALTLLWLYRRLKW